MVNGIKVNVAQGYPQKRWITPINNSGFVNKYRK